MKYVLKACLFLVGILFFLSSEVGHAQQTELPPELEGAERSSYGNNLDQGKTLYGDQKDSLSDKYKPKLEIKTPYPYVHMLWEDVRESLPSYFEYIWYISLFCIALTQFWLARALFHRNAWMALPTIALGGLFYVQEFQGLDIVALPLIISLLLVAPILQLFQLSHSEYYHFIVLNIMFFVGLVGSSIFNAPELFSILFFGWGLYLIFIVVRVLVHIAFESHNGSWIIIFAFIPFTGLALFNLLCIASIQKEERVNPKFVNIILGLLQEGKNRVEIRSYALKAKIRMNYFDKNYDYAIQLYKKKKKSMSSGIYAFARRSVYVILVLFFAINTVLVSFLAKNVQAYYSVYTTEKEQSLFLDAVIDDNEPLVQRFLSDGKVDINPTCEDGWEDCLPLYVALKEDSMFVFDLLIVSGANFNITDSEGVSLFNHAISLGRNNLKWQLSLEAIK